MKFLFDTNALSEITKPRPDPMFLAWFSSVGEDDIFLSVLTVGELRRGAWRLPDGRRKAEIEAANEQLLALYQENILGLDSIATMDWPRLSADLSLRGVVIGALDELLVATAIAHDLTVVTRNVRHFAGAGCELISPWSSEDRA